MGRFAKWYGFNNSSFQGRYNFEVMETRFIHDESRALEMMKKGQLHFSEMRADAYQIKAVGEPWGNRLLKVKYENREPKNWYFYGWNMNHPVLKSRNVRLALTHLMDREGMIKKFLFGFAKPAAAPIWHLSQNAPVGLKPLLFEPEKALKLLKEDGWIDSD
jgi:peptide/nickel transport system substrate-binding protein/microcin C transport system substrate-binding protein